MRITSRAPLRIEFAGGGTDIPSYSDRHNGFVLNATINKYVYATLKPIHTSDVKVIKTETNESLLFKDVKDLVYNGDSDLVKAIIKRMKINYGGEIHLRSDVPPDTGLGNGATAAVTLVGLFNTLRHEKKLSEYEISETAFETMKYELDIQGGKQSFYSSVFGGFNFIEFLENGFTRVNRVRVRRQDVLELEKNLLLIYIGKREKESGSQNILRTQESLYGKSEKAILLEKLKDLAWEMRDLLTRGDIPGFAQKLNEAFETKKKLYPEITNQKIEDICELVKKHGAIATRIQGAGGGGHLITYCEPNKEHAVTKALLEKGITCIPFNFTERGLEVWEGED